MSVKKTEKIWHNGKLIGWEDAQIHVLSHVVSYGSSVFEGIRCYETKQGPATFRLRDHMRRLRDSGHIYRMESPFSLDQLCAAAQEVVRENQPELLLRPSNHAARLRRRRRKPLSNPIEVYIACWEWGAYLGTEALEQGVDVCVSSWSRMAPNTLPAMAKAGANYMNSQLIRMEAIANGYAEGIALDVNGYVSEGSGENVFVVRDGAVHTPPVSSSGLAGITRNTIMMLCHDLDIPVQEQMIPREMLYIADEVFLTGTAAEVTPLRSIDRITIGAGKRGPIHQAPARRVLRHLKWREAPIGITGSRP